MKLSEVQFKEFLNWMGRLEEDTGELAHVLGDSMDRVPLVTRLMMIHNDAGAAGADEFMILRIRDMLHVLVTLDQLEHGHTPPPPPAPRKRTPRKPKAHAQRSRATASAAGTHEQGENTGLCS